MNRLRDIFEKKYIVLDGASDDSFVIKGYRYYGDLSKGLRVNVLAMGDVGSTMSLALMLCGKSTVESIGLCDAQIRNSERFEFEFGQIAHADSTNDFPKVRVVSSEDVFDCDVLIFCAAKGVPRLENGGDLDVRMAQLSANADLVRQYARMSLKQDYEGEFFVVSDPVDPLCKVALTAGIDRFRIQGFGLGVMNARASYYASRNTKFSRFFEDGRVYGPHGEGLIVADSISNYNDETSIELTELTIGANMEMRRMGFKPYIAPAVSSGALSILDNLVGRYNYSSAFFGNSLSGAFWGMKNRRTPMGLEVEDPELDPMLMKRIEKSYGRLADIL